MTPSTNRRRLLEGLAPTTPGGAAGALSGPVAGRRAFDAEKRYVADRLEDADCLRDWSVNEGSATGGSTVIAPFPLGLRVSVTVPYTYTTETSGGESVFADDAAEAVYDVTPFETSRIRGDEVPPCG